MEHQRFNAQLGQLKSRLEQLRDQNVHVPDELMHVLQEAVNELTVAVGKLRTTRQELHDRNAELDQAYRAAESERRRYHELFTFAPDGYLVTNAAGFIVEANRAVEQLLQAPAEHLCGRSLLQFVAPEHHERFTQLLQSTSNCGGVIEHELTLKPARGKCFPASLRVAVETGGQSAGLRWLVRDITKRRAAEQQIAHYQSQLRALASDLTLTEQRERRRLATELHDYMAQLLVVSRMKVIELDRLIRSPRGVRILGEISGVLKEALRYTRTLIAELSPTILYDSGLPAAINWLATQMRRHGLDVTVDQAASSLPIPDDVAIILFEVLRELLMNVVRHSESDQATVSVKLDSERLTIEVRDNGIGFDLAKLDQSPSVTGRYGLFSVRERLEALSGSMEIESRPGRGTCVRLSVGVEEVVPEMPAPTPVPTAVGRPEVTSSRTHRRRGRIRIVLADDHALVREGLRKVIENQSGLEVVGEAADGEQAVELARKLEPDVIVMDVNMPRMNGIEATRRIRMDDPVVHVVGLSVHDDSEVAGAMREAGASAFLCKSEASYELCAAIRSLEMIEN